MYQLTDRLGVKGGVLKYAHKQTLQRTMNTRGKRKLEMMDSSNFQLNLDEEKARLKQAEK
jgi:hypothetical protein